MLDSVNQHALDRVHVFEDARHQIARRTIVKPAQRQQLDVRIKIAPQIENHFLLESVVQNDAQRIEAVLQKEGERRHQQQRRQSLRPVLRENLIDHELRHRRERRSP